MGAIVEPTGGVRAVADEAGAVDAVRGAHGDGTPLRIVGRGTWLDAGRPVAAGAVLDVSALCGIVEYTPGDLTLTVRAGTTLAEIDQATRAHGQWLPLDPFGTPAGTLGATLATASAGPLASGMGAPRDLTLGVTFVTGLGRVVRGGGRVVKNVAGFDLVRLTVGAWGTTGVIIEATVRLSARPDVDETVALPLPEALEEVSSFLSDVRRAHTAPLAAELVSSGIAGRLGLSGRPMLLVRLAGNSDNVRAQRAELARTGETLDAATDVWDRLRRAEPGGCSVVRLSSRPSDLSHLWSAALPPIERAGGEAHASLGRGVMRCWLTGDDEAQAAVLGSLHLRSARIFERLPRALWPRLAPPAVDDRLSRAIRHAFDPAGILNPGVFGGAAR